MHNLKNGFRNWTGQLTRGKNIKVIFLSKYFFCFGWAILLFVEILYRHNTCMFFYILIYYKYIQIFLIFWSPNDIVSSSEFKFDKIDHLNL